MVGNLISQATLMQAFVEPKPGRATRNACLGPEAFNGRDGVVLADR